MTNFGGSVSVCSIHHRAPPRPASLSTDLRHRKCPWSVSTADVNGDGKPDLIVPSSQDGAVSVLLNSTAPGAATPSFAAQQIFRTGGASISVATIDVNGDGKPDLIVGNDGGDNTISVLLNSTAPGPATASFVAQQTFPVGSYLRSVTVADVNGDGKPDLIGLDGSKNSTVSVLLNTSTSGPATAPSFAGQQPFPSGNGPESVAALDINGDGKPDSITANYRDNSVSVLLNTTAPGAVTPSFAAQQTLAPAIVRWR